MLKFLKISLIAFTLSLNYSVCAQEAIQNESSFNLTQAEQTELEQGQVILKGTKGSYIAQVEATGSLQQAWAVLTDYNNFHNFIPKTVESQIIEEDGDRVVFEQVNSVDLIVITKQFRVRIAANKTPQTKIDFEMIRGDLGNLKGNWQIELIDNDRILITHQVHVSPKSPSEGAIFYGIYEDSLEETLIAIAEEITRRN